VRLIKLLIKFFLKLNLLTLLFISSCAFSPGMSPKLIEEENIYNNLKLNFYDIEDINLNTLPKYSEKYKNDQRNLEEIISNNEYRYLIGPGDKIKITLTDIEDINGEYVIDSDGLITLPYAGKVNVVDQTKNQVQEYLKSVLDEYYQEPEVIVEILEYNSRYVYITGEITKPQSILLTDKKLSIVDAILNSGYIKDQKSFDKKALLKRKGTIYVIDLYSLLNEVNDDLNIFLQEEDILHIQKKSEDTVYVFGEAGQGTYPLFSNSSLTKILTNAKINQVTADTNKIYVIRESLTSPMEGDVYQLKAKNPNTLLLANQFNLLPGDVIFVSPANIVRWNRVISLITPQSGIFTTYKDINATLESEFESGIAK
jgi:polysaccharide export outer membrane protein